MCWLIVFLVSLVVVCLVVGFIVGLNWFLYWLEKKSEFLLAVFCVLTLTILMGLFCVSLYIEFCIKSGG